VRELEAEKLSSLLIASVNKYLVAYIDNQGRAFVFGSDGGASFSFTQQTGQLNGGSGYQITLSKQSVYPQFEVKVSELNKTPVWILDTGKWDGGGVWTRTGKWKTI